MHPCLRRLHAIPSPPLQPWLLLLDAHLKFLLPATWSVSSCKTLVLAWCKKMAQRIAVAGTSTALLCGSCGGQATSSARLPFQRLSMRFGTQQGQPLLGGMSACRKRKCERSVTVCSADADSFFDSSIVQNEIDRLQSDYQALLKLGRRYGQFDREGKKSYISEMKTLLERWQIFYKRMELSDDFTAKLCAKQLKSRGGPLGLSNLDLVQTLYTSLDEMREEAEGGP